MVKNAGRVGQRVAEILELPKEIVMDVPKVTITGNIQLNIENHRGIMQYEIDKIRVSTSIGVLTVTGNNLVIKNIVPEEIVVTGEIGNVDISV